MDYEGVRRLIETSDLSLSPSEAQGILCGLICGGDPRAVDTWLGQVLDPGGARAADLLAVEARQGLARLAAQTLEEIQGPDLGLSLLLPDESEPLEERATAVYDWVRGFLFGLGVLGIGARDLSDQGGEILRDFFDLTRLDLNALDEGEDNEAALTEITEFVRIAAMLLYQERVLDPAKPRGRPQ
ncbi:MAG: UPF0149 family protein [Bdellovibrio bacteriovorus]